MQDIPRWGLVTAAPHQHLIHIRKGRVVQARQGGSCFKWPSDAVALVDTSVHRLQFTADQITREKTGVQVTGLAVFRIVQPLLAYRMLNLEEPRGYVDILREMLMGATRRLVANLELHDCVTRRKEALARELMGEIAPVISGAGRDGDSTDRGWGVALDTIEIQDVRVLSSEVFERLQAPFREALALEALQARAGVEREQARIEAERLAARERQRQAMMEMEEARLAAERAREQTRAAHAAAVRAQQIEAELTEARSRSEAALALAELDAQAERIADAARIARITAERAAMDQVSPARLQELALTETLPRVAEAFRGSFDTAVVTGGEMGFLSAGLSQVLATLGAFGIQLPEPLRGGEG